MTCNMKEIAVCSPEIYSSAEMQEYIAQKTKDKDKQWIYSLIDGKYSDEELVYRDDKDFMICRDIHPGSDKRYLVIFKDRKLKTIRDLDQSHVPMLERVNQAVRDFLSVEHREDGRKYRIFFHYTPSVFQLHAHVTMMNAHHQNTRIQPLHLLVRNLKESSTWYKDGLILISLCRSMKALHVYRALK